MLLEVVDQATGGADQDVDAFVLDFFALLLVAGAAVHHLHVQPGVTGQHHGIFMNLDRQFAGRRQHQRARLVGAARLLGGLLVEHVQGGEQKGRGFAGAGLCLAGDILSVERQRQGGGLDRGAVIEPGIAHAGHDRF